MQDKQTVLHITDRLSHRGGADWHLSGVLRHPQCLNSHLLVGRTDPHVIAPCPLQIVPGLDARIAQDCDLDPVVDSINPSHIHIHNVVNPVVLEWAADRDAMITIQDHRAFCPGRGKWKADGSVCTDRFSKDNCAVCFDDTPYFEEIHALTARRFAAIKRMRTIIVLSHYMRDELIEAGLQADAVHVIPPFVCALDTSARPTRSPCILFVGRLVEAKGVWDAVHAWRQAELTYPLIFVGTGPLAAPLRKEGFHATGWVDRQTLSQWYASAKAVIVPSRWQEPFGIVGLEAAAFGLPVVATASGGIPEWHPGHGMVAPGDRYALSQALRNWAKASIPPLEPFEPSALMDQLNTLYMTR